MSNFKPPVYDIEKSILYRLRNRTKLAILLRLAPKFFSKSSYKQIIWYQTFSIAKLNGEERIIHNPNKNLKNIQKRILRYLSRIATPHWLMSGKKGKSYIDNGKYHKSSHYVYTADIRSFYDSCRRDHTYKMFLNTFKMSPDVACILTDIVTNENCLPTGSPASQLVAYWTYNLTFKAIASICENYDAVFSLYVDDMTFSSNEPISDKMIYEIETQLKKVGLELKKSKTKYFLKNECKLVTGVAIDSNKNIRVPNKIRKAIINNIHDAKLITGEPQRKLLLSLRGRLRSARLIEPNIFRGIFHQTEKLMQNLKTY